MENVIDGGCTQSDLILKVRKNTIRFHAGSELSSSVNRMKIEMSAMKHWEFKSHFHQIDVLMNLKNFNYG